MVNRYEVEEAVECPRNPGELINFILAAPPELHCHFEMPLFYRKYE